MSVHLTKPGWLGAGLVALMALSGCDAGGIDLGSYNLRTLDKPARTESRPKADARGVITYPDYQMVEARRGDTVAEVAERIGLSGEELARHNGLDPDYVLRSGELLALPRRVEGGGTLDIETIATNAIDSAGGETASGPAATDAPAAPIRHRVERGETAYTIARLYHVSVTALASWNGLGPDLKVRVGQQLLIPTVVSSGVKTANASSPGAGSPTPTPPSASEPLPKNVKTAPLPPSPGLGKFRTGSGSEKFLMPVSGDILKPYSGKKGGNEGIDIAASAGTTVKAAGDGEVALISKSVDTGTIILLRHADNIYTVYANISDVKLTKGQKVKRGQPLGKVVAGDRSYLHFEVRRGTESVDPMPFL
ncbi:MAG: peptidoglycan DD-metalloendopeptidase family protein [Paracoccaceae bacterium]